MSLRDTADRYKQHNDAIARKQAGRSAPPGKKCEEPACDRPAFPWERRCVTCEKKHQKALRAANQKPLRPDAGTHARDGETVRRRSSDPIAAFVGPVHLIGEDR